VSSEELQHVFERMEQALATWGKKGTVSLTGGEPYLRRNDLYALARAMDTSEHFTYYDVLTNGSLVSVAEVAELRTLAKLRRVQLSLESPDEEENDSIRGPGSYSTTVDAIQRLKTGGIHVSIMMTISRLNYRSVPRMIEFAATLGVDALAVERFIPEGSGKQLREYVLTRDEVREVYALLYERGLQEKRLRVLMYRPLFALFDCMNPTVGAMCSAGVNALTIMNDGTLYPCRRLPISIGNVLTDGLFKPWYDSEVLWKFRDPRNIKGKCGDCAILAVCRGCRAMAYWLTDDYLGEDPHCWREITSATSSTRT
jgi:radical SAM protein with 4Fe4S-binding SPASM domain